MSKSSERAIERGSSEAALLITAPHCSPERPGPDGIVKVEAERFEPVRDLGRNSFRSYHESSFGGEENGEAEREMKEMNSEATHSSARKMEGEFDHCHEYNLEAHSSTPGRSAAGGPLSSVGLFASAVMSPLANDDESGLGLTQHAEENVSKSYLLGKTYHPIHDFSARRDDERSLFWFTYRNGFPEISPYSITSDSGWGCMLRSAQMMLGQALRLHFKSRQWRPHKNLAHRRQDAFIRSMLTWFADYPSKEECLYSLHNMVAAGLAKYDKLPGEWYGPGTACYVMRDLVQMHERQQESQLPKRMFRVLIASQGSVYRDTVDDFMLSEARARYEEQRRQKSQVNPQPHPLDSEWEQDLAETCVSEWDTSLLLLIPLRLGLNQFNEDYVQAVAHTFSLPQSVGVLGGKPRGARWFYGAQVDGRKIYGLDPHTVQPCPRRRTAVVNGNQSSAIELSDDYLRSCHTMYPEVFSLSKMDPSIALGFYCKSREDLDHILQSVKAFHEAHPSAPELFSVADRAPDYSSNLDDFGESAFFDNSGLDDSNEEDEYVVL